MLSLWILGQAWFHAERFSYVEADFTNVLKLNWIVFCLLIYLITNTFLKHMQLMQYKIILYKNVTQKY
jgi:hypothetical protein